MEWNNLMSVIYELKEYEGAPIRFVPEFLFMKIRKWIPWSTELPIHNPHELKMKFDSEFKKK